MAYKIFTDATADLNDELLRGLPEVTVILKSPKSIWASVLIPES